MLFLLDIDGVMVPAKGWKSPEFLQDGFPAFSTKAVAALQSLLSVNDTVILTTSHKSNYNIMEWKNIFKNRGITINLLATLPTNTNNANRKDEIIHWFTNNTITDNFVIIDDDKTLQDLPKYLKNKWVQTSPYIGLTIEHVAIVKAILNKAIQTV